MLEDKVHFIGFPELTHSVPLSLQHCGLLNTLPLLLLRLYLSDQHHFKLVDPGVILDFLEFLQFLLHLRQRPRLRLILLNLCDRPSLEDTLSFLLPPLVLVVALDVQLKGHSQVVDEGETALYRLLLMVGLVLLLVVVGY